MNGVSGDHVTGSRRAVGRPRRSHRAGGVTVALAALASSLVVIAISPGVALASTIVVTTTETAGTGNGCGLREAIINANSNSSVEPDCASGAGADVIVFAIPGVGPFMIRPPAAGQLPPITDTVVINGYSQTGSSPNSLAEGSNAVLMVELVTSNNPGISLDLSGSTGSEVRGLILNNGNGPDSVIRAGEASTIAGNWIGLDTTGSGPGLSQGYGIMVDNVADVVIGGTAAADRNVIGTNGTGIKVVGADAIATVITGNYIGTNASGAASVANGVGIHVAEDTSFTVIGGTAVGAGNVISGNNGEGVLLGGNPGTVGGVEILGNLIGTEPDGTTPLANGAGVRVGFIGNPADVVSSIIGNGTAAGRNVISGNNDAGISLADGAFDTTILGNYIGVGIDGITPVGNFDGVQVGVLGGSLVPGSVGPTTIGSTGGIKNVISGNRHEGISIANGAIDTTILGTYIGVGADGTTPVGNNTNGWVLPLATDPPGGYGGIVIRNFASFTTIGGTGEGEANVIANNLMGVTAFSGSSNSVVGNRIFSNAAAALNIGPDVSFIPPPNDAGDFDFGANNQQNSPIISASVDATFDVVADFSIDSNVGASAYPIDLHFYSLVSGKYLGETSIAAPGTGTVNLGNSDFLSVDVGQQIVATATDANGNTSNFSAAATVADATFSVDSVLDDGDASIGDGVCATSASECTLRAAIQEANATLGADAISFNIPGPGVHTITLGSALPSIYETVTIDALTQPGSSCAAWPPTLNVELNAANAGFAALFVGAGSLTLRGMVVNRYPVNGVSMYSPSSGNRLECNFIGTNASGTAAFGASQTAVDLNGIDDNVIGGPLASQRNLIAGVNQGFQLFVAGDDNVVQGNYIGVNATGGSTIDNYYNNRALVVSGNNNLIGGDGAGEGNTIANSYGPGVAVWFGDGNTVSGNHVFGNLGPGITTETGPNTITGNQITGNRGAGVSVTGGVGNQIVNNEISANGSYSIYSSGVEVQGGTGTTIRNNRTFDNTGLGIDLGPDPLTNEIGDRVTFNHGDSVTGPNNYQNYPVIEVATSSDSATRVMGRVDGTAGVTYAIDVYVNNECDASGFGEGETHLGTFDVTADGTGLAAFDHTINNGYGEPVAISTTATNLTTGDTSEFSVCRPTSTENLTWVTAQNLSNGAPTDQYITDRLQEKWFKIAVQPGDKVKVELTGLPGSAVSLHRDPLPFYNSLTLPENAAVLSAEAADVAFLPSGSLPSGFLPSGFLPSGFLPSGFLPSGFLPSGFLPSGFLPSGFLPSGSLPSGSLPSGSLPSGFLPSGFLPSGFLPSGFLPDGSSLPSGSLPSGFLPSGFLPSGFLDNGTLPEGSLDAYASASRRSLMGVSMDPYAAVQTIERSTFDLQEFLYVRVVGPYSVSDPFQIEVTIDGGVCSNVLPVPPLPTEPAAPGQLPIMTGPQPQDDNLGTVILTDSTRLGGTDAEVTQALADLETLADQAEVQGVVVDLGDGRFPRVEFANAQADQYPGCPSAKNTVAAEIKAVVDLYRAANVDADGTTLQYVVLAGSADVIPFHQVQDVAGLANEKEYVPPVDPGSPSEAGLRSGLVKGQDFYGSSVELTIAGRTMSVPDLAVGRLVDSAADVSTAVIAFLTTGGEVTPGSSLVTGYDFVGDAARAIEYELGEGIAVPPDAVIQDPGGEPIDGWTADDLRSQLLAGDHDVVMLSGHFSAGNLLAADYRTSIAASELSSPTVNLTDVIVMALGCHGGFSLPDTDLLDGASPDPDWAKAFLRKGAAAYIAATGYAYGDTELTEYGERLFLNLAQQMRTGEGPIPMGKALVAAKQAYLNSAAQLTGMDEKTVVEMTLYGLPMMKVNMPVTGTRLPVPNDASIITSTSPVGAGPGAGFELRTANATITPGIEADEAVVKRLENLDTGQFVDASYYPGRNGVVTNPYEPILPKQVDNVTVNGQVLRGVALRGATFVDDVGVTPLTSAPATEVSVPHSSFNTSVFYPNQMWMPNYYDAVGGGATRLVTVPAQFRSSALGQTDGTLRRYTGLQLQLYYMPSNLSAVSPEARAATVSAGPSITGASAVENEDGSITFSVNAYTDGVAGMQSVWVLITGDGTFAGTWTELVLTPNPDDPTLWSGTLADPGISPSSLRFMVQAVTGAGLTALATNLGAFYTVSGFSDVPPPPPTGTQIVDVQIGGTPQFQAPIDVSARVQTTGLAPVVGQAVVFDIGGSRAFGVTNTSGLATATITPTVPPGTTTLQVSLPGSSTFVTSTSALPLTVARRATALSVAPQAAPAASDEATGLIATLAFTGADAPGIGGKSVTFAITGNGVSTVRTAITDIWGQAELGPLGLPAGTYDVSVSFGRVVDLGGGQLVDGTDDSYLPSGPVDAEVTILDAGTPTITAVTTLNNAAGATYTPGTWTNQSVFVDFTCTDDPLGSGIASCGPDTTVSTPGITPTVTGTAVDNSGLTASTSVGPIQIDTVGPTIAVTAPAANASVAIGAVVNATYGCTDTQSGVATCAGPVATGSPIDTATAGPKTFTVNATDALGNTSTVTVNYTVTAVTNAAPVVRADMGAAGLQDVGFRTKLIVLTGSFSDVDGPGPYTASVRWSPTGSFSPLVLTFGPTFVASYLSPTNGTRIVTVRICDARGTCGTDDVTVRTGVTQKITPVRQCVVDRGRNANPRYEARFGYDNPASFAIVEPTVNKVDNFFTSNPAYRGQPQVFLPGSKRNVFSATFHSGSISWKLDGKTVTANSSSPRC